ncbi:hypothetical protein NXS19_013252 [Fusarium pseudograminearum]|nr:hypothetical protein NXS19_013252 [Fusarium pseudograminearum]
MHLHRQKWIKHSILSKWPDDSGSPSTPTSTDLKDFYSQNTCLNFWLQFLSFTAKPVPGNKTASFTLHYLLSKKPVPTLTASCT